MNDFNKRKWKIGSQPIVLQLKDNFFLRGTFSEAGHEWRERRENESTSVVSNRNQTFILIYFIRERTLLAAFGLKLYNQREIKDTNKKRTEEWERHKERGEFNWSNRSVTLGHRLYSCVAHGGRLLDDQAVS